MKTPHDSKRSLGRFRFLAHPSQQPSVMLKPIPNPNLGDHFPLIAESKWEEPKITLG